MGVLARSSKTHETRRQQSENRSPSPAGDFRERALQRDGKARSSLLKIPDSDNHRFFPLAIRPRVPVEKESRRNERRGNKERGEFSSSALSNSMFSVEIGEGIYRR